MQAQSTSNKFSLLNGNGFFSFLQNLTGNQYDTKITPSARRHRSIAPNNNFPAKPNKPLLKEIDETII